MTKEQWSFSISALRRGPGRRSLRGVNDFTALALRMLQMADLRRIGAAGQAVPGAALALPGAGAVLFASGRRPSGVDGIVPVTGEGGHAPLAPQRGCEATVVRVLVRCFGRPRAERALSGAAIELFVAGPDPGRRASRHGPSALSTG